MFLLFTILMAFTTTETPVVKWLTPTSHDCGTTKINHPVKFVYKFQNISGKTITIDNVRTSCDCTVPTWTEEPIEADQSSEIPVIFDAKDPGLFNKKIKVYFHGQRKAEVLELKVEVIE